MLIQEYQKNYEIYNRYECLYIINYKEKAIITNFV